MSSQNLEDQGLMEVTGRVLIATIIALVFVLILVFFFHIYSKWLWHRRQQAIDTSNTRRQLDQHAGVTVLRRGLDAAFLKTLPVSQFDPKDFKDGLECSVCLSEVEQGEKTRCLPKCNHAFHAECIDMWFHSHSTCPICRNPVSDQTAVSVESLLQQHHDHDHEAQQRSANSGDHFPTNVLFWGDETEVSTLTSQLEEANNNHSAPVLPFEPTATASTSSSSSSQSNKDRLKPDLVIDIPRQGNEDQAEEERTTPIMRSLRRILSSSRRFNPFSPGSSSASASASQQPQS